MESTSERNERRQYSGYRFMGHYGGVSECRSKCLTLLKPPKEHEYAGRSIVALASCESVILVDMSLNGLILNKLSMHNAPVTIIAQQARDGGNALVVGYEDGIVLLCNIANPRDDPSMVYKFEGHGRAVECAAYSNAKDRYFATGSRDCSIILWDAVSERAICRLKSHKDSVQAVIFANFDTCSEFLLSGSKDRTVRIWDLELMSCIACISDNLISPIWDLVLIDERFLVCGEGDNLLRVYELRYDDTQSASYSQYEQESHLKIRTMPSLERGGKSRTKALFPTRDGFVCLYGHSLTGYRYVGLEKAAKRYRKRVAESDENVHYDSTDLFIQFVFPSNSLKHQSIYITETNNYCSSSSSQAQILVTATARNELSMLTLTSSNSVPQSSFKTVTLGHPDSIRCMTMSTDEDILATASSRLVLLWNMAKMEFFRSFELKDTAKEAPITCLLFSRKGRKLFVSDGDGNLHIFDISCRELITTLRLNEGAISGMKFFKDENRIAIGSKDKCISIYDCFNVKEREAQFVLVKKSSLADDIEAICLSPNNNLIVCALLDCTIEVLFADTFKLFLNLFGHAGPVTSLDVSFDNEILISGSIDRTIRVWGLHFGECRRCLKYHEGDITAVMFVPQTYHFFSTSKDKRISRWDAEHYQRIQSLKHSHFGPVSTMVCGFNIIVSASVDKSLRVWKRCDEFIIPQIELNEEQEKLLNADDQIDAFDPALINASRDDAMLVMSRKETALDAADRLTEALELHKQSQSDDKVDEQKVKLMLTLCKEESTENLVLNQIKKIQPNLLNSALHMMPFSLVPLFCELLHSWLFNEIDVEICINCVLFILTQHYGTLSASDKYKHLIEKLASSVKSKAAQSRESVQANLAAMVSMKLNNVHLRVVNERVQTTIYRSDQQRMPKRRKILDISTHRNPFE